MKQLFLIVLFCLSRLVAQVSPPDLRCLEVLPNGNVKLTWIPPADPGNFDSYEIFFSINRPSGYVPITSTLTSITTNTYMHVTTAATNQAVYYYMRMRYGSGGSSITQNSDTLGSIFLTAQTDFVNGRQIIKYYPLHEPGKLPSSATTYTLNKEYPLGTWKLLSVSSQTTYPDTITACRDSLNPNKTRANYLSILEDNSGCISTSNMLKADYVDIKTPERPYVDSISVLPDGSTALGWQVPIDKDIEKYNIQYESAGHQLIGSVPGRNSTSYTYTTPTANSHAVGVFVQAVDTCGNVSTVNYLIRTLFVRENYNRCAYQTTLRWNPYVWSDVNGVPVETLGKYKIYYSVNGSAFNVVGETTDTNFVHSGVDPGKNICYFIRVVNQRQTVTASSNRICFFSDQVQIPGYLYIKTASVLSDKSNVVKLYVDNSRSSQGISILRSENGTDFSTAGFVPYSGDAHYEFVDENVQPSTKNYYYKAFIIDSCGNLRNGSNLSRTILLKVREEENQIFNKQLSWTEYIGFSGNVSGYYIYRIVNGDVNKIPVGSTDALTLTYNDNIEDAGPQGAKVEYMVQAVEGISNAYGIMERSNSNPVPVYMEGAIYVPNAFAPAGLNKTWRPVTYFIDKSEYRVTVFNRWGKKVFETSDDTEAWTGADCTPDVYVYLISYKNSRGEYLNTKGTVTLIR